MGKVERLSIAEEEYETYNEALKRRNELKKEGHIVWIIQARKGYKSFPLSLATHFKDVWLVHAYLMVC